MMPSGQVIFLIGLPGSGKTTTGKLLARLLQCPFVDTDQLIENQERIPIGEIFVRHGENYFRQLETDLLTRMNEELKVVATGGGMPCFDNNIQRMKEKGRVVYLKCTPEDIASRLSPDELAGRPLLMETSRKKLNSRLHELLFSRSECYEAADITIECQQSIRKIVKTIELCLRQI